jgi:mannose-1-phosphate guanylyltransferase/mannose-6-phosphate isomerase
MSIIVPIILAGGSGTRLWPISRKNFPKQFICLNGKESLLQQTFNRAKLLNANKTLVITNQAHYFLCQDQLHAEGVDYILEPNGRNTAPAIAVAALYLKKQYASDISMVILPSDHHIGNIEAWHNYINYGIKFCKEHFVTFGIKPTKSETGYGYIESGDILAAGIHKIRNFHEKPDLLKAQTLVQSGTCNWNSGMFVFDADLYLRELERHAPEILTTAQETLNNAQHKPNLLRLYAKQFDTCPNISIDYAIMEHTKLGATVPMDLEWSDLGCWSAVAESNTADVFGNVEQGNVLVNHTKNSFVSSTGPLVTTLGLDNHVVVATQDAVLVANKQYTQQVKDLVASLAEVKSSMIEDHHRVSRPWGYYEVLIEAASFKVKRLMVKPHAKLSLQMHQHRSEHWVVVEGIADVVNGVQNIQLLANQSTYIPAKNKHRLVNNQNMPLYVIEVQSGEYLGEDDIKRFDDVYDRVSESVQIV